VWLLPPLLRALDQQGPRMRVIALPVQFRTVAQALTDARLEAAITVADDLPAAIKRQPLFSGGFVCLFDPRHARLGRRVRRKDYFAHDHVVVSYNGDLRGIVEDMGYGQRRVRCSVSSFANLGAVIDGSSLVATVPALVARQITAVRRHLRTAGLPFSLRGTYVELLWPAAVDDDEACRFLRARITEIAASTVAKDARRSP
jgi:LysR family transcriptional regulator, mexEF-oprN operon transcriptional activator